MVKPDFVESRLPYSRPPCLENPAELTSSPSWHRMPILLTPDPRMEKMTTLPPGTRLGPYEIVALAGSGGMGEVYKARDTRLDRIVAIKVLPRDFSADADRRARFEREARVVASLSHPHICALHDVGSESSGLPDGPVAFLVMEFLEGTTLAERLTRGALPRDQVVSYGRDIAGALDAAHRQQVVHRDLKPGNVMITRSGPKLLDFGLARSTASDHGGTSVAPTTLGNMTIAGTVLGTLPYMAPEQVEGRPSDQRSDIFALGAVIYEMATGRRTFTGDSPAALMSSILTTQPPAIEGSPDLDRIVRGCLDKDPDRRWQSAHDVALQLDALAQQGPRAESQRRRAWLPWASAAAALLIAAVALVANRRTDAAAARAAAGAAPATISFAIPPPPDGRFVVNVEYTSIAVSPDGTRVAYSAVDDKGQRLWVRSLAEVHARPLEGTENATSMFWSPDGRHLAFFADGRLKRLDLQGGPPVPICAVREGIGQTGTWGADGRILFASGTGRGHLQRLLDGRHTHDPDASRRCPWRDSGLVPRVSARRPTLPVRSELSGRSGCRNAGRRNGCSGGTGPLEVERGVPRFRLFALCPGLDALRPKDRRGCGLGQRGAAPGRGSGRAIPVDGNRAFLRLPQWRDRLPVARGPESACLVRPIGTGSGPPALVRPLPASTDFSGRP